MAVAVNTNVRGAAPKHINVDSLARTLHSALVSQLAAPAPEWNANTPNLEVILASPAFLALLSAIRQHARLEGVSEAEAARAFVGTFRSLEAFWKRALLEAGLNQLSSEVQNPTELG